MNSRSATITRQGEPQTASVRRDNPEAVRAEMLATDFAHEMADRWERGEQVQAEEYLGREELLSRHSEAAARLIYEEICLRQEAGLAVSADEFFRRFPQWTTELKMLLECHRLMEPDAVSFPEVGHSLGGF